MMIETHPFGIFVPQNARYLILGSFTGRQAVKGQSFTEEKYDWFYATKRNQFWPILEEVYGMSLPTKQEKKDLFTRLGIGIADIISQCERQDGNNLDSNLKNIVYNKQPILEIMDQNPIETILFSSKFVEKKFKQEFKELIRFFPQVEYFCLPSPSPRFARMSKAEKIIEYRKLLPKRQI